MLVAYREPGDTLGLTAMAPCAKRGPSYYAKFTYQSGSWSKPRR
jgi:hypothetical protein